MPERELIPSIDMRLSSLLEFNRRREMELEARSKSKKARPTITISREFGCEAYPMVERLKELLEKKSGEPWVLMDKALLEEVARRHDLLEGSLEKLGEKVRFLDEMLSTFTPRWKSDKDYFRLLCRQIVSLAETGNVIIVGRGGAIVTQPMKNCHHFRLFASQDFKIRSIARRLDITREDAEALVVRKQQQRDKFIRDFLDRDARDLSVYNLVFNNDKNTHDKIARTIMEYVLSP
ncbi:MAG: cytidylate kinase-like family protein [Deltaproteobacteria bacterium]|nr:cytidylate kinase-like family protein [Deltaproteobacteria bacterium]